MSRDAFSALHPIICFFFYIFVILAAMFFMHPLFLLIALQASFSYALYLNGGKTIRFTLLGILPMMLIAAALNPIFNHQGVTILTYLDDGNPLTLESILYGIAAVVMFSSVILWFSCYNQSMTSDKFLYLFGKISPKFSLVLSLSLRFVPLYQEQIAKIRFSQKAIGRDFSSGSVWQRIKNALAIFSILVTWALENAIITSDAMQARGYGLKGRSHYSLYRFDRRDIKLLAAMLLCGIIILLGSYLGYNSIKYYPSIKYKAFSFWSVFFIAIYALFCNIPLILDRIEDYQWKRIKSKI